MQVAPALSVPAVHPPGHVRVPSVAKFVSHVYSLVEVPRHLSSHLVAAEYVCLQGGSAQPEQPKGQSAVPSVVASRSHILNSEDVPVQPGVQMVASVSVQLDAAANLTWAQPEGQAAVLSVAASRSHCRRVVDAPVQLASTGMTSSHPSGHPCGGILVVSIHPHFLSTDPFAAGCQASVSGSRSHVAAMAVPVQVGMSSTMTSSIGSQSKL